MGMGASFTLDSLRPPPHGHGRLLRFGFTEAPAAWPPSLWDHRGPRRMSMGASPLSNHRGPRRMGPGASFTLDSPRPPPHGQGRLSA